jgi:hypothetical protein
MMPASMMWLACSVHSLIPFEALIPLVIVTIHRTTDLQISTESKQQDDRRH